MTEKLRLLHLVLSLDPGGTQRLVIEMTKRLRSRADIQICCLDEAGEWSSQLTELGIPISALGRQPGFRPSIALSIAEIMRRQRTEVLHCHHYSPYVYGALASRLYPAARLVFTEHGRVSDSPPSVKRRLANLLFGRLSGRFFTVSMELRDHLIAEGFPAARVDVIYNGVDPGPDPTPADRDHARRQFDVPREALVIGTVARLDPVKDLETLLQGFAIIARSHPHARLVLMGDGPERQRLESSVVGLGLGSRVSFLGNRTDVRKLLPGLDIYVNTSLTEGFSLTILEAMSAALPIVATRVGGTPEIVVDRETGLLIEPSSPGSVATAVTAIIDSPARRQELGIASRRRVQTHFTLASMVEKYVEVYELG